ncbi:hypothetical protein BU23DRAFT_571370 [Bimuria novae-zelandiae CBS 107.79]|uniref:Uncharacterized protein n=1 Tax=Bimuria novae-zelandiae CBS 107.79 TaxID=1447943 RepID=A0A6A5V3P5_9PLEO|nr:hypothetical protein BU23DRAFT_571370 [Bimuria novae-zelandiae CBS 107.79]
MMPGAGLYLPDTLSKSLDPTEARTVKPKYFGRKSSQNTEMDRKSLAISRASSEDVTRVFSSLPTVFDFADWASAQGKVSSDNKVFVSNLQRVRRDITEASRLCTSQAVTDYLESWPDKKIWIDDIIRDIERALKDIGLVIETVRVSGDDGGTVDLRRKFQWALSHQKKLMSKQQHLMICHQSLMSAVQLMQNAEMNATFDPIYELAGPPQPWMDDASGEAFKSPHLRQKWRMNQRNSSVPSITISEPEGKDDKTARPYQHMLAELPGSTPDDLHRYSQEPDHEGASTKARSQSVDEARPSMSQDADEAVDSVQMPMVGNAQIPRRRPPDPPRPRRSFDNVRSSISTLDDRARASFDMARPRAYSEQVRTQRSFEIRNRTSHDQVRPMPTLTERPIERFNSTASVAVGDAVSVPLASMRYRSKPITVRKPPAKHRSLPSELPSFPSQTSLMDDLSTWVIPHSVRESYRSMQSFQSVETSVSIGASTPATSAASSLIAPEATWPRVLTDAGAVGASSDLDITSASEIEGASVKSSLVSVNTIPVLPSRPPPPAPPVAAPQPPPIPPKIPVNQPPQPDTIALSRSFESLFRSDSAPIPPPLSRRRKAVRSRSNTKTQDEPRKAPPTASTWPSSTTNVDAPPGTTATEIPTAITPEIPIPAGERSSSTKPPLTGPPPIENLPSGPQSTEPSLTAPRSIEPLPNKAPSTRPTSAEQPPTDPQTYMENQNSLHHITSSASATDKYPIPFMLADAPPVPALPPHSPPIEPHRTTSSQTNLQHFASNASATDKYPIALSPTSVSALPVQSSLSVVSSVETLASDTPPAPAIARPMTALAKRRAAHARRMQMAFGPEAENA